MKRAALGCFPVVDLFAGPGGLGEGFSAFCDERGHRPFRITLSVEKEESAFETLCLRSFLRQFNGELPKEYYDFINTGSAEPDWEKLYPAAWRAAHDEVLRLELGTPAAKKELRPRLKAIGEKASGYAILVGGPPCQAYSLVGRARNRGVKEYDARKDRRHFLYREYIDVIRQLKPAIFVMENVKGMLSSSVDGREIFDLVLSDLRNAGGEPDSYRLFSLAPAVSGGMRMISTSDQKSYVVRAEDFGIPQARHRVILLGVRAEIPVSSTTNADVTRRVFSIPANHEIARSVLDGLPKLRSGLSGKDSDSSWTKEISTSFSNVIAACRSDPKNTDIAQRAMKLRNAFRKNESAMHRSVCRSPRMGVNASNGLKRWILDPRLRAAPNNETRSHMSSDLARYMFASIFGEVRGRSPTAADFPKALWPAHRNWKTGKFADRFRVQLYDRPSSTITSHISKDGHYFIHPDPMQCRSLTVREAARLQTFPDNYLFKGNRTQQYVQVGNAVPPYLAVQIAAVVFNVLRNRRR